MCETVVSLPPGATTNLSECGIFEPGKQFDPRVASTPFRFTRTWVAEGNMGVWHVRTDTLLQLYKEHDSSLREPKQRRNVRAFQS